MEPNQIQTKPKASAKDFFLNLGAIVALYTVVQSVLNLLFTIIDVAYPQINYGYSSYGTPSISWPVAILIIAFPILIVLMWLLEKDYALDPGKKTVGIHKWLSYITLFIAGLVLAGDLITVLYYFLDGQELTTGFLFKVLVVFVVALCLFMYYISDIRGKLTRKSHMIWRIVAAVIVIGSIILGFSILGSPQNRQLLKYDEQKTNDLFNIKMAIEDHYSDYGELPDTLDDIDMDYYYFSKLDLQTQKPYEYHKTTDTIYELCAEFNKSNRGDTSIQSSTGIDPWIHDAGRVCFRQPTVTRSPVDNPVPTKLPM